QDDDVAGPAAGLRAAVVEALQAVQRDADGIAVVAVRVIGVAGEEGLEALQFWLRRRLAQPVAAGSFKTLGRPVGHSSSHALRNQDRRRGARGSRRLAE